MSGTGVQLGRAGWFVRLGWAAAAMLCVALGIASGDARAEGAATPLAQRLSANDLAVVFPGADRVGEAAGSPPAAPVYRGAEIVGYIFSTLDVVKAPGYSSVPFDVVAGVALDGTLTGAKAVYHLEPHIANSEQRQGLLATFLASHQGYAVRGTNNGSKRPDFVAGATVSARLMRAAVVDSARFVLQPRVGREPVTQPTLDMAGFKKLDWDQLVADGSIVRRTITNGEIGGLLTAKTGKAPALGAADAAFGDLYLALASPPSIGRNLLGVDGYKGTLGDLERGAHAILVASNGPYDFIGIAYYRKANNYRFDRVRLVQGDLVVYFDREHFYRTGGRIDSPLQKFARAIVYIVPPQTGFDPLKPWTLELGVPADGENGDPAVVVPVAYRLPQTHILMPDPPPVPAWVEAWQDKASDLAGLGILLAALTLILALQRPLARRRRLHRWVRIGFLSVVLGWLGWAAGGQLTIIHLANYAVAPLRHIDWGFYLTEPLIVVITIYTAFSLVLLGRGVFCGWLCPFGALQELLAHIARVFRLPQWAPPDWLDRRLAYGKYATAAAVIAATFASVEVAAVASEVEPFRTAITEHFARDWPYLAYAAALLSVGLFVERFYCRFLCPLGGALAVLGRLHLFDALKRRPACGSPCRLCEHTCPVKAIERSGRIDMAECFQCLDCQVEYYDDRRCPPLAFQRKRRTGEVPTEIAPASPATSPLEPRPVMR